MVVATALDSKQISTILVTWLNSNLTDPYEQATGLTRDNFVYGDDFRITPLTPIIHVDIISFEPTKISVQSKTAYLEEEAHNFIIYYYNEKGKRYTFPDTTVQIDEAQCMKYLQYIKNTLKSNMNNVSFKGNFHKATFGTIPKPIYNQQTKLFMSLLPITLYTYRR